MNNASSFNRKDSKNGKGVDKQHPATGYKERSEWDLRVDDQRPEHQKMNESPKGTKTAIHLPQNSSKEGQNSNPSTSRLGQVDEECAVDFVAAAFNDASEKDVLVLKSDR